MTIHPQTAFFVIGALYIALPFAAWTLLRDRSSRLATFLWCAGTLLHGVGFMLVGLRGEIPNWASFSLANPLAFLAWGLQVRAMQAEAGARPTPWSLAVGLWFALSAGFVLLYALQVSTGLRLFYVTLIYAVGASAVGWLAWQLRAKTAHRSALLLAWAYATLAAAYWVRLLFVLSAWGEVQVMQGHWTIGLAFLANLVAALFGNLGFIGLTMDRALEREVAQRTALAQEHEARRHAELRSQEQGRLLEERSRLLAQREEILSALAHEVRQPLNNASAALQSAESAVRTQGEASGAAAERLQRASEVLGRVVASVDNTLADVLLLDGRQALSRQDVDIEMLIQLVLGDLPGDSAPRVRVERRTATRTAAMHLGLMRIALRNLLLNALAYSPSDAPVHVRIADSDEPLALLLDIADAGAGLPQEVVQQPFGRGVRGERHRNEQGHGLGLHIVRRILELHGGSVTIVTTGPTGTTFRLTIPQDCLD